MFLRRGLFPIIALVLLNISLTGAVAQNEEIALTLRLSGGIEYLEENHIFDDFEEQNPGIRVYVTYNECSPDSFENCFYPRAADDLERHFNGAEAYSVSADVLMTSIGHPLPPETSVEGTRAGYFLDLVPLIQADETFNSADFYPRVPIY